jgi:hypothetical protein
MKKFDTLVNEVYTKILSEAPPTPGLDQTGGNPPPDAAPAPAAPAPAAPVEVPKPVSSEGLRNLIDLVQRALVISPDSLDAADKSVFNDKVTIQNALEKQQQLTDIVDRINPAQTEVES